MKHNSSCYSPSILHFINIYDIVLEDFVALRQYTLARKTNREREERERCSPPSNLHTPHEYHTRLNLQRFTTHWTGVVALGTSESRQCWKVSPTLNQ